MIVDGGNSNFNDSMRRAKRAGGARHPLLDAGTSGGVWGLEKGYCLMVGGAARRPTPPIFRHSQTLAPEGGLLHTGPGGRGPLHEDGPQRHRVWADARRTPRGSSSSQTSPVRVLDLHADRRHLAATAAWCAPGCWSSLHDAPRRPRPSRACAATSRISGEGRWTVQAAIDQNVPAPVITLALQMRLRRGRRSFSAKVMAALRNEFGGHAVKKS